MVHDLMEVGMEPGERGGEVQKRLAQQGASSGTSLKEKQLQYEKEGRNPSWWKEPHEPL